MKKAILITLAVFAVLFISIGVTLMNMNKPLPKGATGSEAERLTSNIEKAIAMSKWKNTVAVEFVFAKRNHKHFRDKKRDLVEVIWGQDPLYKVIYSNKDRSKYVVWIDGKKEDGESAKDIVEQAYSHHTNDYFWLNPYSMLRAPGTVRRYVGEQALLVTFESGGVTPGDSYLIITDANHRPTRMQMWVSVIPMKGIEWVCDAWEKTSTGAWLNKKNTGGILSIEITNVKTWANYPTKKEDRFSALVPLLKGR